MLTMIQNTGVGAQPTSNRYSSASISPQSQEKKRPSRDVRL